MKDVSLSVPTGAVFGLLGPNGAGKTTLIKILLGLVGQTSGQTTIAGVDTRKPEARRIIGFLPENHHFPGFLTGVEMLTYYGQLAGVDRTIVKSRIPMLLEQVDMAKWGNTKIKKYSKGMMQRIGLAQSLINDPEVIFLDEPTDGVDPIGRREIRRILQWLNDQGKTIFLNSHLLSEVEQVCTEVAILNHGTLVTSGSIADLTTTRRPYAVTVDGIVQHPELLSILGDASTDPSGVHRYHPNIETRSELNDLIDRLRENGIVIDSIERAKQTLEDSFIDLLDKPKDE